MISDKVYSENSSEFFYDLEYEDSIIKYPNEIKQIISFMNETPSTENNFESDRDTIFYLYTVSKPTDGEILILQNLTSILDSNFKSNIPTR